MKNNNELKRSLAFIDSMAEALSEQGGESIEEIREELRVKGIDLDASVKNLFAFVKSCSMDARREELEKAAELRSKVETDTLSTAGKFASLSKEDIIERIRALAAFSGQQVSVAYRELEGKDQEDLASILEDLEAAWEMEGGNKKK
jgi:hypothetical protein